MRTIRGIVSPSLLALLLASTLVGCGGNLTPEESIAKANELMGKGELRSAMIELSNAAQKAPNLMEARWLLAKVAVALGEGARAEKEIRKAMELGQTKQAAQPLLAKSILLQGDLERVLKETASMPEDMANLNKAAVLGLRAQALLAQGKLDIAKPILEDAIRVEPNAMEALIGMAAFHGLKREYDESRRWVQQALKVEPASADTWSALGDLELAQGKKAKAEEAYTNAIKHRGVTSLDSVKRALVRMQLKKFNEAGQDIAELKKHGLDKHPVVNNAAGRLFFAQKKYKEAAEAFEASQSASPENRVNTFYLATTYHFLGQQEKALALVNRLSTGAPRSLSVKQLLGSILISQSDYDAANEALISALAKAPNDFGLLNMLATISMLEGNKTKGLEYASRLVTLAPNSPQAKAQLMAAKMVASQPLDTIERGDAGKIYTTELLLALDEFRNNRLAATLEQANNLHTRYPNKVDPINLKAAVYLRTAQWDKAIPELEKVLKLQPNEPSATRNLAKVEVTLGNLKRARELLLPLVKAKPEDEVSVLLLANVEARLGNATAILPLLAQTVASNPEALDARSILAAEYLRTGKIGNVLELTKGLTDTQLQRQPGLLQLRGKAQILSGDTVSSRKTFESWTRLAPNSAPAHFYLSDALSRSGDLKGATKALGRAVILDPRYIPARVAEVKMLMQAKNLDQARKALVKLRQDFGESAEVLGMEGGFAQMAGDYASAENKLSLALKKKPNTDLAIQLVQAQWAQKKYEVALRGMQSWLKDHPSDLNMAFYMAGSYQELKRNDDARATYTKIVEKHPNFVPGLNNLALLFQDNNLRKAMEYAQRAQQLAPKDPIVLDTLGMLTLKNGDIPRAFNLVKDAATLAPAHPGIQLNLARILLKQQRMDEARKLLSSLIKKSPESTYAQQAKELLNSMKVN